MLLNKSNISSITISTLLFIFLVTIPTLSLKSDIWDGTIIEYASKTNNFNGIYKFFIESHWFLQYPLSVGIIKISNFFSIGYKNMNAIIVSIIFILIIIELTIYTKNIFKFSNLEILLMTLFVAVYPVWNVLLSSIMTLHIFCIALGLVSIRFIHSNSKIKFILGYILLIFSFNLQSLFLFLPCLSYTYDVNANGKNNNFPSFKTFLIFSTGAFFYILFNFIYPPIGLYKNYNSISFFSSIGLKSFILGVILYLTFLAPILTLIIFVCLKKFNITKSIVKNQYNLILSSLNINIISVIFLLISSIGSYLFVGKFSYIFDTIDWGGRQAILLFLPLGILNIFAIRFIKEKFIFSSKTIKALFLIFILTPNFIFLSTGVLFKLNRQKFVYDLEILLKKNKNTIPNGGIVQFICNNAPKPNLRFYETNLMMYNSIGIANYWTSLNKTVDNDFKIPEYIISDKNHQQEYIFNFNKDYKDIHTIIELESINYDGLVNVFKNFFYPKRFKIIKIKSIKYK